MTKSLKLEIEDLEERIAPGVTLLVGILSPQGTHTVFGPGAAAGGAETAFTAIMTKGPVELANIDILALGPC